MKIWITGIAGFLGSHLAETLIGHDHEVTGNDNFICGSGSSLCSGLQIFPSSMNKNMDAIDSMGKKKIFDTDDLNIETDCRDFDRMLEFLNIAKPDVLIHCAATAHEGLSNFSPSFITKNIYEASVATFSAAIAASVKRIVFMSSMARYGNGFYDERESFNCDPPFKEDYNTNPLDPYGIAKVAAEKTLIALCKLHNVEYVIAVPHNIIGIRQKYDDPFRNVASIMINRALQGKPLIVYGDGLQKRCFSPIKDCLDSLVQMIDAPISGEIINIGPDKGEITVLELARMIIRLTGGKGNIMHMPDRPNEVKEAYCSSDKARKLLGYEAKQPIEECLVEMVDYIKTNGTKPFAYNFPIEIEKGCPETWVNKLI